MSGRVADNSVGTAFSTTDFADSQIFAARWQAISQIIYDFTDWLPWSDVYMNWKMLSDLENGIFCAGKRCFLCWKTMFSVLENDVFYGRKRYFLCWKTSHADWDTSFIQVPQVFFYHRFRRFLRLAARCLAISQIISDYLWFLRLAVLKEESVKSAVFGKIQIEKSV